MTGFFQTEDGLRTHGGQSPEIYKDGLYGYKRYKSALCCRRRLELMMCCVVLCCVVSEEDKNGSWSSILLFMFKLVSTVRGSGGLAVSF